VIQEQRRPDYGARSLGEADLPADPLVLFGSWLAEAAAHVAEPEAMTLATVDALGHPRARMVLLRGATGEGFRFFTHLEGAKGRELARTPWAALVFHWPSLSRQVRVEGPVQRLERAAAEAYFRTRPRESQLGAWASPQSEAIPDRAWLEERLAEVERRFAGQDVPCPPHWGGYQVVPLSIEFWQGRRGRLHDRHIYRRPAPGGAWAIERLAP
jgi:pyridoxamine 5'-phosphate oxidase